MELKGTFPCYQCDRVYSLKKNLNRHVRQKHCFQSVQLEEIANIVNEPENEIQISHQLEKSDDEVLINLNTFTENDSIFSIPDVSTENVNLLEQDNRYIQFVLKYISKPEIPRSYVVEIIKDLSGILKDVCNDYNVEGILNKLPVSEAQIDSTLKSLEAFIECRSVSIQKSLEPFINFDNTPDLRTIDHYIKIYPLFDLFSMVMTKTNLFEIIADNYDMLAMRIGNGVVESIIQTRFYGKILELVKQKFDDNLDEILVLPLCIYIDDFEPNNPLGSRSSYKKISGVYSKIPCLPPIHQSKMCNVFRLAFFHSDDRKRFTTDRILTPIKNELNDLSENLIAVNHRTYSHLRLIPCLLMGDNLGLNQNLDGIEGFNSDRSCRLCFLKRSSYDYYFSCPTHSLYTKDVYLNMVGQPHCCFNKESVLNELYFFHASDNPVVDPLHDLLEGDCKYDFMLVLYIFVKKEKYFTIEYLNQQILSTFFCSTNSPPLLDPDFRKTGIRMSASEMRSFITMFPILVGSKVPRDSEAWYLYILMRHIVSISFSYFIYEQESADLLRSIIPLHNKLYYKLYKQYFLINDRTGFCLPFKFHIITHYPYIMERIGPLGHVQNLRFESGHQVPKRTASSSKCKINILETITKKVSYEYSNMFLNSREYTEVSIAFGKKLILNKNEKEDIRKTFNFYGINDFNCFSKIEVDNKILKPEMVVKVDGNGKLCHFNLIKFIFKYEDCTYFAMQILKTIQFDEFLFCFEVEKTNEFRLVNLKECDLQHTTCIYIINSKKYLTFNDYFYFDNEINF